MNVSNASATALLSTRAPFASCTEHRTRTAASLSRRSYALPMRDSHVLRRGLEDRFAL